MHKIYKSISRAKQAMAALALVLFSGTAHAQNTYTFNYTGGQQTINLQAGTYTLETWGADGGMNLGNGITTFTQSGGKGGYSVRVYTLASPTTVFVNVGGIGSISTSSLNVIAPGGYNGGGYGSANGTSGKTSGSGGGGASHVATATGVLSALISNQTSVLVVAGGGGGAGESNYASSNTQYNANGGNGGGLSGFQVVSTGYQGRHGQGGTQVAGGGGGDNGAAIAGVPLQGIFGAGGFNPTPGVNTSAGGSGAGGGGGGWYGGGCGWVATGTGFNAGAGGGGSGYLGGVTTGSTLAFGQAGYVPNPVTTGNGLVLIRELCSVVIIASGSSSLNPSICSGQTLTLTTNAVSNYSWSTGQTSSSIIVAPNTNTVYSLAATSSLGCNTSTTRSVTVSSGLPVLSISNPSTSICLGKTVSLTASGALTYTWTNAGVVNGQTFTPSGTAVYTVTGQNGCGTANATTTITVAPLPVSTSASPSLVCEGYPATLTGVSAVTGYTWMPGSQTGSVITVAPFANTIYTVTASDGICSGTQTLLLSTKTTPSIVTSQTLSNICAGQSVNLSASGAGTGGTYSWTPGGAGSSIVLAPSTSTSVVVAGTNSLNCTATALQIILVNQPPALAVTANKFAVCTGDPVILTASGAPIYQWANGPATANFTVNPAVTSVYTITGSQTSNTCTIDATITINAIVPNVSVTSSVAVCIGGSVAILANGASLYKWNGGLNSTNGNYVTTPAVSSVFTLVATTSSFNVNCLTTHFASVTVNQNPTITVTPGKETICRGETHTLTANGASTYSWSGSTSTGSVITVKPTSSTFYTVTGMNVNGCESSILYNAKVNSCNGIDETAQQGLFSVYPNPNNGQFFVRAEADVKLTLINTLGQVIQTIELNSENGFSVEVTGLAKGVYYLNFGSASKVVHQSKLIVN